MPWSEIGKFIGDVWEGFIYIGVMTTLLILPVVLGSKHAE